MSRVFGLVSLSSPVGLLLNGGNDEGGSEDRGDSGRLPELPVLGPKKTGGERGW
ncbi:MAG TPA: hypothetical protein VNN74_07340 [Candidatus Micrarchaeia archaeon]|nr:hypothetical protein [Candidatus Micrarchaeia archaeon]